MFVYNKYFNYFIVFNLKVTMIHGKWFKYMEYGIDLIVMFNQRL